MKKIKLLLPVIAALLVMLSISLFAACKKSDNENLLQSIEITKEPLRTEFLVGEQLSTAGIEVTATFSHSTKVLTEDEYTVNASAYNSQKKGVYEIEISYTNGETTKSTSYEVEVKDTIYHGIDVSLKDGVATEYVFSGTMYFDLSNVVVKEVDGDGIVIDQPLDSSEYEIKVYVNGTSPIPVSGTMAILSQRGEYQIWAIKESSIIDGYVCKDFIFITVV